MQVCVLSSGSKGNCTYIETKEHKILIDVGTTCSYIEKSLKKINVLPQDIDIILMLRKLRKKKKRKELKWMMI